MNTKSNVLKMTGQKFKWLIKNIETTQMITRETSSSKDDVTETKGCKSKLSQDIKGKETTLLDGIKRIVNKGVIAGIA